MAIVESRVHVEQVVVVPRNGLANRLQAWASAAILAAEWDAPLKIMWEAEAAMPAEAADLFAPQVVERLFTGPDLISSLTGLEHSDLPRHLSRTGNSLVLAGHDLGEQAFMPEVVETLRASDAPLSLILIAGGKFHLPGAPDFIRQRGIFYRELAWSDSVNNRYTEGVRGRGPYAALHVRQTDRSQQAPSARMIREGLSRLRSLVTEHDLFIATDTDVALAHWTQECRRMGFRPWSLPDVERSRSRVDAVIAAAADWRLLAGATGLVYPAVSTFSGEASVASGHPQRGIALEAGPVLQRLRSATEFARAVLTYPIRRRHNGRGEGVA